VEDSNDKNAELFIQEHQFFSRKISLRTTNHQFVRSERSGAISAVFKTGVTGFKVVSNNDCWC